MATRLCELYMEEKRRQGHPLDPRDHGVQMILVKLSRYASGGNMGYGDGWLDIEGYARLNRTMKP